MVKIMEIPIKMDDLGGTIIFGNTQMNSQIAIKIPWHSRS